MKTASASSPEVKMTGNAESRFCCCESCSFQRLLHWVIGNVSCNLPTRQAPFYITTEHTALYTLVLILFTSDFPWDSTETS